MGDAIGHPEPIRTGRRATPPAQRELRRPRQADLVICDKTIEATFNRLKDFRRIATRYDKLERNYATGLALAADIAFWC